MSSRMVNARGYLRDAAEQRRSVVYPGAAIPKLQAVAGTNDDDLLAQLRVLAEEARHHDPPGVAKTGVVGAAVEEALKLGQSRGQRRQLRERALGVALVVLGTPHADVGLEVDGHRQHHALGERRPVTSRNGEPVLGVERVVEGAAEGHCGSSNQVDRAGVEEWEEPLHPGSLTRTYPTSSHNATLIAHFLPQCTPKPPKAHKNACIAPCFGGGRHASPRAPELHANVQSPRV